jgi:geranylgeranyl reductase family protein
MRAVDLLIVGAGPAGSAAALAALQLAPDARVVILDRAPIGRDKICGDGIAPHVSVELASLGVSATRPGETVPLARLVSPGGVEAAGPPAQVGHVIPRQVFDERMLRAAIDRGAQFVVEKVSTLRQDDTGVTLNDRWRAPFVLAADGSNSTLRRLVGQKANRGNALAVAIRGYAPTASGTGDELLLRWDVQRAGGLCYAWAFPTANGTSNVGYGMSSAAQRGGRAFMEQRMRELLPEFDLTHVELTGHTLPLSIRRPQSVVGRVLLLGDAASLVNPFTGEGIHAAIVSGALAGRAAIGGDASSYAAAVRRRFGRQHRQARLFYPAIDSRLAIDAVVRAASRNRAVFERLVDVGLGDASISLADLVRFARHIR